MKSNNYSGKNPTGSPFYTKIDNEFITDNKIQQIIVISDLHLSEGYSPITYRWHRRENFTVDKSFNQFLAWKRENAEARAWLIINGDFIDFLRITSTPSDTEILKWEQTLQDITSEKLPDQQQEILDAFKMFADEWRKYVFEGSKWRRFCQKKIKDELKYGLKTQDFKSIYRLMMVNKGHKKTFEALANWLNEGHLITIISGNHDQEFDQDLTQAGFTWMMEKMLQTEENTSDPDFSDLLSFERHGLKIANMIRIEHGNRFEWHTRTVDISDEEPRQELFLAPGSLFNRYFLNRAELGVPFLDNVKPVTRVISFLFKRHKGLFFKILGKLIATTYRLAFKKGARCLILLGFLKLSYILIALLYILIAGYLIIRNWNSFNPMDQGWIAIMQSNLWLFISLPIIAIVTIVIYHLSKKLTPQFNIDEVIEKMSRGFRPSEHSGKRYAICGHKHRPDIQNSDQYQIIYLNSGTWCPVFEYDSGIVRDDLTMTFLELKTQGDPWEAKIMRWLPYQEKETEVILREPLAKKLRSERQPELINI